MLKLGSPVFIAELEQFPFFCWRQCFLSDWIQLGNIKMCNDLKLSYWWQHICLTWVMWAIKSKKQFRKPIDLHRFHRLANRLVFGLVWFTLDEYVVSIFVLRLLAKLKNGSILTKNQTFKPYSLKLIAWI